jgi:hypothetical protein
MLAHPPNPNPITKTKVATNPLIQKRVNQLWKNSLGGFHTEACRKGCKTFRNISPCTCLLAESSHEATEDDDQEGKGRSTVGSFVPLELL